MTVCGEWGVMVEVRYLCGIAAVSAAAVVLTPAAIAVAAPTDSNSDGNSAVQSPSRGDKPELHRQLAPQRTGSVRPKAARAPSRAAATAAAQILPARSVPTVNAASTRPTLASILQGALSWFQHTLANQTPTFSPEMKTVALAQHQTSQPLSLEGDDPDGDPLVYTIAGTSAGAGNAGGTLQIAGDVATYTPPDSWDGIADYDDTFVVDASEAGTSWHIHGLPELIHILSFGVLGSAGDTATATVTVHVTGETVSGGGPTPPDETPVVAGSFPVALINNTGGAFRDDQIFVTILGQITPGAWAWVDKTGSAHPIDHTAASAPGHLIHDDVDYANMSFTLEAAQSLRIPPELQGARIYISLGAPLYIGIAPDNSGWAGPDPNNPTDPNFTTVFDWYELTTSYGHIPFGGNTTQVDQFGLPIQVTLQQAASGFSQSRGLTASRAEIMESFATQLPAEFQSLVITDNTGYPLRILAPRTRPTGALADWFAAPVDQFWSKYSSEAFIFNGPGYTVSGGINANSDFAYTVTSGAASTTYTMAKPTSAAIFAANGPFVGVGAQGAFLAELNAAFNRGVAADPSLWNTAAAYYPAGQRWNAYAKFFHDLSIAQRAYGFPYDDVNDQSPVQILNNSDPPDLLTLTIGY